MIKRAVRTMRSAERLKAEGLDLEELTKLELPLKRVIDTVHFADKSDARPLQLADLCAFILARGLKDLPVPQYATQVIWRHAKWILPRASPLNETSAVVSSTKEDAQ
jgi:hypothetical protein